MFLAEDVRIGLALRGGGTGQTEFLRHRLADSQESAVSVLEVDAVWNVPQQMIQQIAFVLELLLRQNPVGDIPKHQLNPDHHHLRDRRSGS